MKGIRKIIIMLATVSALALAGCIRNSVEDCGFYLEFVYDYNMEYVNSFEVQVPGVDVFVFDQQGTFLFTKHANQTDLIDGRRMFLDDKMSPGDYKILTIGGLSDKFLISDTHGRECLVGVTRLEDVRISLKRESDNVSHEFPHLWVGETIMVSYTGEASVWTVELIKYTNQFSLLLSTVDKKPFSRATAIARFTFEIVTPEGAVYAHNNYPTINHGVTYTPYFLEAGSSPGDLFLANINTMRLLYYPLRYDYVLIVRDTRSGEAVLDLDLMRFLNKIKPSIRPDGTPLPIQEYLDRQSQWSVIIFLEDDASGGEGWQAIGIKINNWMIWFRDLEM